MDEVSIWRKISKKTTVRYTLFSCDGEYAIECRELDRQGNLTDCAAVNNITSSREKAYEIFSLLVKNKACACTLYDIIYDLLC